MKTIIYDKEGSPCLIIKKNGRLVDFYGKSVGFLHGDSAFDYNGNHRGWFETGILRDHFGNCVGFMEGATGIRPILPIRRIAPIPAISEIEPIRPVRAIKPIKAIKTLSWSPFDPISLFRI